MKGRAGWYRAQREPLDEATIRVESGGLCFVAEIQLSFCCPVGEL